MRAHRYGESREALLQATVDVVADKGLRGLTYRAVAEHAGVTNTLITHHFGSRDALIVAAVEWAAERSVRLSSLSTATRIDEDFARALVDMVRADPNLQVFQFEMVLESRRRPELRPAVAAFYRHYIDSLEHALSERGAEDVSVLARAIFAALDGLVMQELAQETLDSRALQETVMKIGELLESQVR